MGLSIGEIVVILAVGTWAFGPKELPRVAKSLGRLTGQATGFLYRARAQLFQFAEQAELDKVQKELQATMYQLQVIQNELRGGINILDPGPLTRRALGAVPHSATPLTRDNPAPSAEQLPPVQLPFAASTAKSLQTSVSLNKVSNPLDSSPGSLIVPISAAAAGLVPQRLNATGPSGSEVLADALAEERVARAAVQFMQVAARSGQGGSNEEGMPQHAKKPRARRREPDL